MNIAIGKYTLESLTSGMYITPMVIYREYVQNAIDAIDDAIDHGIIKPERARVTIEINSDARRIVFEDNGSGVPAKDVEPQLLGIGNSNKDLLNRRGFRGIGRLVGIGYTDKLSFYTSCIGEKIGTIISIDCKELRQILIPGQYEDFGMVDALKQVIKRTEYIEKPNLHYFRVILDGICCNEQILNYDQVSDYLCQTVPLPYNPDCFSHAGQIEEACLEAGHPLSHYSIFLKQPDSEEEQLFKIYSDRFFANMSKHQIDNIQDIKIHTIMANNGDIAALLWYGQSHYLGTILDDKLKGLRFRKGNILVGDRSSANLLFKEDRFNGWFQGEVFVFDDGIIPNSRRDDFEQNDNYRHMLAALSIIGMDLSRDIRQSSTKRNNGNNIYDKIRIISNQSPAAITKYPQINLCSNLNQSEKKLLEKVFETLDESSPRKSTQLKQAILDKIH